MCATILMWKQDFVKCKQKTIRISGNVTMKANDGLNVKEEQ